MLIIIFLSFDPNLCSLLVLFCSDVSSFVVSFYLSKVSGIQEVSYTGNMTTWVPTWTSLCSLVLFCLPEHEIKRICFGKNVYWAFHFQVNRCFGREGFRFISSFRLWNDDSFSDWWGSWTSGMFNMSLSFNILIRVCAIWLSIRSTQVCREKAKKPQVWEDVPHISG